jgi:UPF0755 protein
MPMKRRNKIIIAIIIFLLLDILIILFYNIYTPYDSRYYSRTVTIPPKTSTYGIGLLLEHAELINSPLLFFLYVKIWSPSLKAGNYQLDSQMSLAEIVRRLQAGAESTSGTITIPEGFNLAQIAAALQSRAIIKSDEFLNAVRTPEYLARYTIKRDNLEGYLFPDTYRLYPDIPAKRAIELMLNQFDKMVVPIYQDYLQKKKTKLSLDEIITLASLIEKEAGNDAEKNLISAVFYNRIKLGMPLQCDPTIRYIVKKPSETLTKDDLQVDSPYNTYLNHGLPPGPICSPGLASIEAALAPASAKYLYFVSRNDGTHEYSFTLDQHNAAVIKYQRNYHEKEKSELAAVTIDTTTTQ